jgi:hypothetical protein
VELGSAIEKEDYEVVESDHFLVLASARDAVGRPLLRFAEDCLGALMAALPGIADFQTPGKQLILVLRTTEVYYSYIAPYYPEGEFGGSGGVQIREGYPHIVLWGKRIEDLESAVAHELMHVALHRLTMPEWIEEGLALMFEHDRTGRSRWIVDGEMARKQKSHWRRKGLEPFWSGEGFSSPDETQEMSYQLAEILVRLLMEDSRPGWFGRGRERRERFFAFLREADASDAGAAACRTHLQCGLDDLAARFLGPGSWSPSVVGDQNPLDEKAP